MGFVHPTSPPTCPLSPWFLCTRMPVIRCGLMLCTYSMQKAHAVCAADVCDLHAHRACLPRHLDNQRRLLCTEPACPGILITRGGCCTCRCLHHSLPTQSRASPAGQVPKLSCLRGTSIAGPMTWSGGESKTCVFSGASSL